MNNRVLPLGAGLLAILSAGGSLIVLNHYFNSSGLYYKFSYADAVLHGVGGLLVGLLYLWLVRAFSLQSRPMPLHLLGFVALIGILWEFYEFAGLLSQAGHSGPFWKAPAFTKTTGWREDVFYADTVVDLFFDLVGGMIAIIPAEWALRRKRP